MTASMSSVVYVVGTLGSLLPLNDMMALEPAAAFRNGSCYNLVDLVFRRPTHLLDE